MSIELLPTTTGARTGQVVAVELRCDGPARGRLLVERRGELIGAVPVDVAAGSELIELGALPRGGYAVTFVPDADGAGPGSALDEMSTALDVLDDPFERPRYGFLADFSPGRSDVAETVDDLRRLHLNVIQFYDWMYRHEELLGQDDEFSDALGRHLSHHTTRAFIAALHDVGAYPMGYAAVYGVGDVYAAAHEDELLYRNDGTPWTLGDFLTITDPSPDRSWIRHLRKQLSAAFERMGFAGFHLDQYGWPKVAARRDGSVVDLALAFPALIGEVRDELPDAKLIFNNVNDFPTHTTASAPQDAVYIEVWSPHDTYADLADIVVRARRDGDGKPVILAAYLEPYANEPPERADAAAQLAFATIAAHGGHHLLCGERGGVLVDPYYPNHHRTSADSFAVLRRLFDASVALGDVLYDDGPVVTGSWFGGINEEGRIDAPMPVSGRPTPGSLWAVVRRGSRRTTVHLIDLSDQHDIDWNRGKEPLRERTGVHVAIASPSEAVVTFTAPTVGCRTQRLPTVREGEHLRAELPPFTGWAVVTFATDT